MCAENGGVPPCIIADPWEWRRFDGNGAENFNTWPVTAGNHLLYVHSAEDGVRLRGVRFGAGERGSCGFSPELLLPASQPAAFATVVAPMTRSMVPGGYAWSYHGHTIERDYMVWTPPGNWAELDTGTPGETAVADCTPGMVWQDGEDGTTACHHNVDGRGHAELTFSCSAPSQIKFGFDIVAVTHLSDSLFVQVDNGEPQIWHIPRTDTIGETACEAMHGELDGSGTICLPAACFPNQGSCVDRSEAVAAAADFGFLPLDMRASRVCCIGQVNLFGSECYDQQQPPCVFRDPFEWREHHGLFDVDSGPHVLKILTREEGLQIRDVRMDVRGTCGFAYEVGLPDVQTVSSGRVTAPMVAEEDFVHVPNGLQNTGCDPDAAVSTIANDYSTTSSAMCGSIKFAFICGGPDIVQFAFEVSAPNGNDDSCKCPEQQPCDPRASNQIAALQFISKSTMG